MLTQNENKREELARYAHDAWSSWMLYLFEKAQSNPDGSVIIPAGMANRWMRQIHTVYSCLSETEKESDRFEADRILRLCFGKDIQC